MRTTISDIADPLESGVAPEAIGGRVIRKRTAPWTMQEERAYREYLRDWTARLQFASSGLGRSA